MKTKLTKIAEAAGGTLEEDESTRDMRIFQVIAPEGKRWACDSLQSLLVQCGRGSSPQAKRFTDEAISDLQERLSHGLEPIPADELEFYSEE